MGIVKVYIEMSKKFIGNNRNEKFLKNQIKIFKTYFNKYGDNIGIRSYERS
jgi:hypothetical protein